MGIALFAQFLIGVIVLRWPTGFTAINFIFREIARLGLYYPMAGAAAVYGDPLFLLHPIAMFVRRSICLSVRSSFYMSSCLLVTRGVWLNLSVY